MPAMKSSRNALTSGGGNANLRSSPFAAAGFSSYHLDAHNCRGRVSSVVVDTRSCCMK